LKFLILYYTDNFKISFSLPLFFVRRVPRTQRGRGENFAKSSNVVNFRKSQNPFSRKSRRRLLIISARAGKKEGGWGEGIFARPRFSAATEFRAPQSGVRR